MHFAGLNDPVNIGNQTPMRFSACEHAFKCGRQKFNTNNLNSTKPIMTKFIQGTHHHLWTFVGGPTTYNKPKMWTAAILNFVTC